MNKILLSILTAIAGIMANDFSEMKKSVQELNIKFAIEMEQRTQDHQMIQRHALEIEKLKGNDNS